jgi:sporulation protein YlmC with PRC-barrel domain
MATNQFESSRIAEGGLKPGAQHIGNTARDAVEESRAISRDDIRDGAAPLLPKSTDRREGEREGNKPSTPERRWRRVLAASSLAGDRVRNRTHEDIGKIEEIMIDIPTGRVAYAVLSFGGFLGIGNKLFAIPWSALRIDEGEHEFILDVDRATLENAPGFDKNNWPDMANIRFGHDIHQHYGKTPYWLHDVTDAGDYVGDNRQTNRSGEYEPVVGYRTGGSARH